MSLRMLGRFAGWAAAFAALACSVTPRSAAAEEIVLPKGTSIELAVATRLDSETAKVGDHFRLTVSRALWADGRLALPAGTAIEGVVDTVRTPSAPDDKHAQSGAIGVHFVRLTTPGHAPVAIEGVLTTLKDDERRSINEVTSKVSTGRHVDVVFIGKTPASQRASTLAGIRGADRDSLAKSWARTGLEPEAAEVSAGSLVAMQLGASVKLEPASDASLTRAPEDRSILVSKDSVKAAQAALRAQNYAAGEATGTLDDTTRSALTLYQLDHRQPATGDLDEATAVSLGIEAPAHP